MGRRRLCCLYCILYILSCVTKHASDYWFLMLGRILGGVATSLLFSSFEAWMVCEHNARGHDPASLSQTFSLMMVGNSFCGIMAGFVAEGVAGIAPLTPVMGVWHVGGYCAPFDLSALCLVGGFILITATWQENYGTSSSAKSSRTNSGGTRTSNQGAELQPRAEDANGLVTAGESDQNDAEWQQTKNEEMFGPGEKLRWA